MNSADVRMITLTEEGSDWDEGSGRRERIMIEVMDLWVSAWVRISEPLFVSRMLLLDRF